MPRCVDCVHFDAAKITCKQALSRKSKLRACSFSIFMKHLPEIKGDVLEVGCGVSRYVAKNVRRMGATWTAIDPQCGSMFSIDTRPLVRGTVGRMPFPDESFDWVISLASIEHWGEHGDTVQDGLKEIRRVLKVGGTMLIDCPIHIHGADEFFYGHDGKVKGLICELPWTSVRFEEWRRDRGPLEPLRPWDRELEPRRETIRGMFPPDGPSQWFLEVEAKK